MALQAELRRNGKPNACEPCRKGKLACDHALPYCGRCTRRKLTSRCIYHPAPMTRERQPETTLSTFATNVKSSATSPSRPGCSTYDMGSDGLLPPSIGTSITERGTRRRGLFKRTTGFQGATSFSAVFSENQAKFHPVTSALDKEADSGGEIGLHPLLREDREATSIADIALGIKAILNFPTRLFSHKLMESFNILHELSLMEPLVSKGVLSIWTTFGDCLAEPRTEAKVSLIAERLCENALKPPKPIETTDATEWINAFIGPNMTWEVLGLIFSCFGMSCLSLQESDPIFSSRNYNRKQAAWRMKECTDACLKMCDTTDTVNDFVVSLMLNNLILESYCVGDESYQIWRRHGDLVGTVLATGLHRLPDPSTTTLTLSSWFRIRLFSACYTLDKSHCAFNGLPPGLSRFYCDRWVPYDLDVSKIIAGPQELASEIARLDPQGWNTDGKIYPVTSQRAVMMLFCIREEIIELALRIKVQNLQWRVQDLLQRCEETYNSFPPHLRYQSDIEINSNNSYNYYVIVSNRLQHLQNIFVLQRIACTRLYHDHQELLDNAQEQMDLILSLWLKREHLTSSNMNFDWILTAYGIPCGGVLCLELLKHDKRESNLRFSQSRVVRQLTMFVGFLEWDRPSDGNYILCQRLAKVVQRILDHVLDPPSESIPQAVSFDMPGFDVDPMLLPYDGLDCLDWLNTADWTQGPFLEPR